MRRDPCSSCNGTGTQDYCFEHDSPPGGYCDCFTCIKCEGHGRLKIKISEEELNKLTLQVTQTISDAGIPAKYNEDNNVIRGYLYDFLTEWLDYEIDRRAKSSYVVWQDLRKQFNLPDPFVKD